LNLVIDFIKKNKITKKIGLFHRDMEAQYSLTSQYVEEIYKKLEQYIVPYWFCVEILHKNYPSLVVDGEVQANFALNNDLMNEKFSFSQVNQINLLINSYLGRKTGKKFFKLPGVEEFNNSEGHGFGVRFFYDDDNSIRFNWKGSTVDASNVASVVMLAANGM
jgi:hypothetical protein